MILALTILLFHICAQHGMIWESVGIAWGIAVFLDLIIITLILDAITTRKTK